MQRRTEHDAPRHEHPSDLRYFDPPRCPRTKRACMVRRRSTVRFRNGAQAQRINSNLSNRSWGPFRGPNGPGYRDLTPAPARTKTRASRAIRYWLVTALVRIRQVAGLYKWSWALGGRGWMLMLGFSCLGVGRRGWCRCAGRASWGGAGDSRWSIR
jgi:hypothetical protein